MCRTTLGRPYLGRARRLRRDEVTLRNAVGDDAEGILECLASAFGAYQSQYTHEAYADTVLDLHSLQVRLTEMSVLVALCGNQIVGTIAFAAEGEDGHLRGMAVRPELQGTGVASILLDTAVKALQQRNCQFVTLDTTEALERAARFYRRAGFTPSGKIGNFFGMALYEYIKYL
jgi:ribosomal protein S18 acetylase RimI-like enzyme